jgi:HAD superfamily hydrolase (TIGR01662 family)
MRSTLSNLKVIFFDFGSTLIYTKNPWPPIYEQADRALVGVLQHAGIPLDIRAFSSEFESFLDNYYAERGSSTIEKTTLSVLSEILATNGFRSVPKPTLREALDAMYAVTQQNWYLEADAIPTLEILRERGLRLGMISNTSDDENVQQLLDWWGLRPYFENVITSAGCGIRKPDERIFRLALDQFNVPPEQTAMVGDTPDADILGANRLGINSIWITRRVTGLDPLPARPDAIVSTLSEIPSIITTIPSSR